MELEKELFYWKREMHQCFKDLDDTELIEKVGKKFLDECLEFATQKYVECVEKIKS